MRLIKIGVANINTTVGAFQSNTDKVISYMEQMSAEQCTIGCFQEQVISGYPCEDLIQWNCFVTAQWEALLRIKAACKSPTVFAIGLTIEIDGNLYNSVAVLCGGSIIGIVPKEKLPTYGIFYDGRTFSRGTPGKIVTIGEPKIPFGDMIFAFPFGKMGVEVCEDVWSPEGPMRRRAYSGAEIIINASASPYRVGIVDTRKEVIATRAADNQVTLVYVNQYGGNDSLVFDGGGFVNQNGWMLKECTRWQEGWESVTVDLSRTTRLRAENSTWRYDCEVFHKTDTPVSTIVFPGGPQANLASYRYQIPVNKSFFIPLTVQTPNARARHYADIIQALVTGLDYFVKTKAFHKIGIALSGGKDSLLTLVVVWLYAQKRISTQALPDFIQCFSMPTRYNSQVTQDISRTICAELGVSLREIPIEDAFAGELAAVKTMLAPGEEVNRITIQNIQARIRGERMQNWANAAGGMWMQTSNMSEKAVGYTTVGGDMMGAYSLIANLPKTLVIDLLQYLYEIHGWQGLAMVLETKASAELADDQEDERDLMPFPVLDACMYLFAEEKKSPATVYHIIKDMWSETELLAMCPAYQPEMLKEWVIRFARLFANSIFKWVQTPQAVHIGKLELDRERALQLPVVQSKEWLELDKLERGFI